jgi:hypothetical protein
MDDHKFTRLSETAQSRQSLDHSQIRLTPPRTNYSSNPSAGLKTEVWIKRGLKKLNERDLLKLTVENPRYLSKILDVNSGNANEMGNE